MKEPKIVPFHKGICETSQRWALSFLLPLKTRYDVYKIEDGYGDFYLKKKKLPLWNDPKRNNIIFILEKSLGPDSARTSTLKIVACNSLLGDHNDLYILTEKNDLLPRHAISEILNVLKIKVITVSKEDILYDEKREIEGILEEIKGAVER